VSIAELPTRIAWYRKHFKLPPDSAGKKVFLEFEGIRQIQAAAFGRRLGQAADQLDWFTRRAGRNEKAFSPPLPSMNDTNVQANAGAPS
jgi:hypothetical protein